MNVTLKQYKSDEIVSANIDNSATCREWRHNLMTQDDWPLTSGDNRKAFREVFGRKPDWYWRSEFYMHVWVVEHNDDTFLVFTAKGKGTCIEIVLPKRQWTIRDSKGPNIVSFVQDLHDKLKAMGVTK